jgi:hypothetical protein
MAKLLILPREGWQNDTDNLLINDKLLINIYGLCAIKISETIVYIAFRP